MTDVLPRLLTIYEQIGDYPLLIPSQLASVNTVCQSIKLFNIRKLTFVDRPTRCESLWMPSHTAQTGHFNEPHINHLRDLLREHYRANQNSQSEGRIYISRSQAGRRKITNESNCIRILTKYDFEIHNFEEHDFSDQAQIAMNAKYLISNHGAGLTNMLFMKKKGSVLELRKREDGHNNCYFALASALDLHYYYQQCEGTNPDEDPSTADILVDCELLERNIRQMLSQDEKSLS